MQRPACDEQTTPHSAGQLVGRRVGTIGQTGELERPADGTVAFCVRDALEPGVHRQVLLDGQLVVQVVDLGHHTATGTHCARGRRQWQTEHLDGPAVGNWPGR